MTREIKFRAWTGTKMVDSFCMNADGQVFTVDIFEREESKPTWIVLQFTGLHDKNGKEIYEGDIVLLPLGEEVTVEYGIQSVDAFEGIGFNLWEFYGKHKDIGKAIRLQSSIEVIGNIYERGH